MEKKLHRDTRIKLSNFYLKKKWKKFQIDKKKKK